MGKVEKKSKFKSLTHAERRAKWFERNQPQNSWKKKKSGPGAGKIKKQQYKKGAFSNFDKSFESLSADGDKESYKNHENSGEEEVEESKKSTRSVRRKSKKFEIEHKRAEILKNKETAELVARTRKEEIQKAHQLRKEKRLKRFKVISQKTSKGQPKMAGRIQMLLEKIQNSS